MTSVLKGCTVSSSCYSSIALLQHHIRSGVQHVRMRVASPEAIVYGVVGLLLAAEGAHYSLRWLHWRRKRLEKQQRQQRKVESCKEDTLETEQGTSALENYFSKLSDMILSAPCTPQDIAEKRTDLIIPLPSITSTTFSVNETIPRVIQILWENRVRYILDEREVLMLLRRESQSHAGGRNSAIAAASLALLWRLQLVRSVHEALIVHEDVSRCDDQLSDLDDYSSRFCRAFIVPLSERLVKAASLSSSSSSSSLSLSLLPTTAEAAQAGEISGVFMSCWCALSAELRQLCRRRHALQLRNLWSLAKYVYTSGRERLVTFAVMSGFTAMAACNATAGLALRERVIHAPLSTSSHDALNGGLASWRLTAWNLISLLAFEWARQVVTEGITRVMREYIRASASRHRDYVKRCLYEALAHTPLSYFDTSDHDTVEQLLYYANDLEGVDVYVHDFFASVVRSVMMLVAASGVLHNSDRAVVFLTVLGCRVTVKVLTYVREEYMVKNNRINDSTIGNNHGSDNNAGSNNNSNGNMDAVDAEEEENGAITADGIMLHGMEIIEHIHELRPYAADTALMKWWMAYTSKYWNRPAGIKHVLRILLSSHRLWAMDAVISVTKCFIPSIVAECISAGCTARRGALTEGIHATQEMLNNTLGAQRVVEVVLNNAYKANVLERILDSRHWEEEDVEDVNQYEGNGDEEKTNNDNNNNNNNNKHAITSMSTTSRYLLRADADVEVHGIRAEGLQFQYPTTPTVNAFLAPLSFNIQLQSPAMGSGQIVCVTGLSGCGKTTLLRLLLALYTANAGCLTLQLRERHRTAKSHRSEGEARNDARWVSLTSIPPRLLRCRLFSYVPQTPTLFPGATIAQNISLQNRVSITDTVVLKRVRASAEEASCVDFIDRLPQGLLTPLADATGWATPGAVRLSGGQAQRLMLARALFHGGGVLLMDEPTAALDSASKRGILATWRDLLQSGQLRGIFCVTHDVEVLEQADHILRL